MGYAETKNLLNWKNLMDLEHFVPNTSLSCKLYYYYHNGACALMFSWTSSLVNTILFEDYVWLYYFSSHMSVVFDIM